MGFVLSVLAILFSLLVFVCNLVLCMVPIFFTNDPESSAKQTIWGQKLKVSSQSYELSVRDSVCASYNNAFQLMEGSVVAGLGLGFIATVCGMVQHSKRESQIMRRPIFILLFIAFLCAVINLVVATIAWEKGFCTDDKTGRTTIASLKGTGWSRGAGYAMICIVFVSSPISGILHLVA